MAAKVVTKRIYDDPDDDDGKRVLVDRIWPRGVSKKNAALDEWCKDIAPTDSLRKWYGHDPDKFDSFKARYIKELKTVARSEALEHLRELASEGRLTLLTGSKALDISQAAVLSEILND